VSCTEILLVNFFVLTAGEVLYTAEAAIRISTSFWTRMLPRSMSSCSGSKFFGCDDAVVFMPCDSGGEVSMIILHWLPLLSEILWLGMKVVLEARFGNRRSTRGRIVGRHAVMTAMLGSMDVQMTVPFMAHVKSGSCTLNCATRRTRLATTALAIEVNQLGL